MLAALRDPRILGILSPEGGDEVWRDDLERFLAGDETLTRRSAGEGGIEAIQRLLIFLGYSTTTTGGFSIDGDFGRGTNRGLAQFQFEHGLSAAVDRATLCYPCSWQTARSRIVAIPDSRLDLPTLETMLETALAAIDEGEVTFGSLDDAQFHLDALHRRAWLSCREILERYGELVERAVERIGAERGATLRAEWVLAIIKQETGGISRPRFEQHKLSKAHAESPEADFAELRLRSMSIGLGQIMGFNHDRVGAPSARAMLSSPAADQVLYVARFLLPRQEIVAGADPTADDFRAVARFYNGPGFARHFYHEHLARWFREFRMLM